MDKETFTNILQSAMLSFDGVTEDELLNKYKICPKIIRAGIKLAEYLKSKEIKKS